MAIHAKPDGAFCGGVLLNEKPVVPPQQMTLYINGQPVQPVTPVYGKCIECSTKVLLNPQKPQQTVEAEYEIVKDAPLQIN